MKDIYNKEGTKEGTNNVFKVSNWGAANMFETNYWERHFALIQDKELSKSKTNEIVNYLFTEEMEKEIKFMKKIFVIFLPYLSYLMRAL